MKEKFRVVYECTDQELEKITKMLAGKGIHLIEENESNCNRVLPLKRNEMEKKGISRISSNRGLPHKNCQQKIRLTPQTLQKYSTNNPVRI